MSDRITKPVTYAEAFGVLQAFEDIFTQKMSGRLAVKLHRVTRPLVNLVGDYNKVVGQLEDRPALGEEPSEPYLAELLAINTSYYCDIECITVNDLEQLEVAPATIVKLESILLTE